MGAPVWISLGSNKGDRRAILDGALDALRATPQVRVRAVSSYHETSPVGGPSGQGAFLNAAAGLDTDLEPRALLEVLQSVEARFGRVRTVRWGERTLDLDLLLYGSRIVDRTDLIVPHLRLAVRRFVLAPLAEIAPDVVEPTTKQSITQLLSNLDRRPSFVAIRYTNQTPEADPVFRRVIEGLGAVALSTRDRLLPIEGDRRGDAPKPTSVTSWLADQLSLVRTASLGDRWLVSDFIPRELVLDDALRQTDDDTPHFEAALRPFLAVEPRLLAPTFLVEGRSDEGSDAALRNGTWRRSSTGFTVAGTPCIHLDGYSAEAMAAEILATCQSTRI